MRVENTDHQMVGLGADQMVLMDCKSGSTIATATRDDVNSPWTVVINMDKGKTFKSVKDRETAINHMIHDRPDSPDPDDPSTGHYLTMVPNELLGPKAMP